MEGIGMSLGYRLKKEREKRNWSQKYVAEKIGITNTVLSNYERDYRDPDTETLKKLADLYGVSTDYLLGLTDNPQSKKSVTVAGQEIELTPEELKLFEELKKHPILFHDLASDPEKKIKELIKLQKMKKILLEDDEEEYGDGFGDLED
jgi:transcriptional regulator with XRE-family HTH domain